MRGSYPGYVMMFFFDDSVQVESKPFDDSLNDAHKWLPHVQTQNDHYLDLIRLVFLVENCIDDAISYPCQ